MSKTTNTNVIKKCLLIGINYTGTSSALSGCINDSENLKEFLECHKYMGNNDFVMMNDHCTGELYPSKANILCELDKLVDFANNNLDKTVMMLVAYSGHGTYMRDYSGDEADGRDEMLCPIDCHTHGYIKDDVIKEQFIDKLPENVQLVMIIDSCHSGSIIDLKHNYIVETNNCTSNSVIKTSSCDVCMISGCRDNQTSSDAWLPDSGEDNKNAKYEAQGAMTCSFIANYKDGMTYKSLILEMRDWLKKNHFSQVPQLSSGKMIDINDSFMLAIYDD